MLTRNDLILNQKAMSLISSCNLLPVKFESRTGELLEQKDPKQQVKGKFWFALFSIVLMQKCACLAESLLTKDYSNILEVSLNFMYCCNGTLAWYGLMHIFYVNGLENAHLVSLFHQEKFKRNNLQGTTSLKTKASSLMRHSLMESIIVTLPLAVYGAGLGAIGMCLYYPTLNFWLYSAFQGAVQNSIGMPLGICLDVITVITMASPIYMSFYCVLNEVPRITVDVYDSISSKIRFLENPTLEHLLDILAQLRQAQLEIKLLNYAYAGFHYVVKMELLLLAISGLFTGIRFYGDHILFTIMSLFMGVYAMLLYVFMFGKMYQIPEGMVTAKQKLEMLLKNDESFKCHYVRKFLAGIAPCDIYAGRFYVLDRMSTPTFIDFVITQVVSLLITFK